MADDRAVAWEPIRRRAEIEKPCSDMQRAAAELAFEEAAKLRDRMKELEALELRR